LWSECEGAVRRWLVLFRSGRWPCSGRSRRIGAHKKFVARAANSSHETDTGQKTAIPHWCFAYRSFGRGRPTSERKKSGAARGSVVFVWLVCSADGCVQPLRLGASVLLRGMPAKCTQPFGQASAAAILAKFSGQDAGVQAPGVAATDGQVFCSERTRSPQDTSL